MLACCYEEALIPVAFGSDFVSVKQEQGAKFPHRWMISIMDTLRVVRGWQEL